MEKLSISKLEKLFLPFTILCHETNEHFPNLGLICGTMLVGTGEAENYFMYTFCSLYTFPPYRNQHNFRRCRRMEDFRRHLDVYLRLMDQFFSSFSISSYFFLFVVKELHTKMSLLLNTFRLLWSSVNEKLFRWFAKH